ncbi:MAG TPA: hypothetical protein VMK12_28615 [Anaeromyxobacteraceae bacterium]|nr:hypothetical protein [Anaeromyxobacteraceae bacterium]
MPSNDPFAPPPVLEAAARDAFAAPQSSVAPTGLVEDDDPFHWASAAGDDPFAARGASCELEETAQVSRPLHQQSTPDLTDLLGPPPEATRKRGGSLDGSIPLDLGPLDGSQPAVNDRSIETGARLALEEPEPRTQRGPPPSNSAMDALQLDVGPGDGGFQELPFGTDFELGAGGMEANEVAPPLPEAPNGSAFEERFRAAEEPARERENLPQTARADPSPPIPVAGPPPVAPVGAQRDRRFASAIRNSLSLLLLVAVALALFAGWRGAPLGNRQAALARASEMDPVRVVGVTGGMYDTSLGPTVLVVKGQVRARVSVPGPVRVRVELVDDGRVVASATALAGAEASAEEVFATGSAGQLDALRRTLDERAARSLPAGGLAPFLVVFPSPNAELRRIEPRVFADVATAR